MRVSGIATSESFWMLELMTINVSVAFRAISRVDINQHVLFMNAILQLNHIPSYIIVDSTIQYA